MENADEREEALPNALANCIANHTPGVVADRVWLEDNANLHWLLEDGGGGDDIGGPTTTTMMTNAVAVAAMQNYDLAYNLAMYLLVMRASRPRSSVVDVTNLLVRAERWATSIVDEGDDAVSDPRLSEHESNPIRANLVMARLILRGKENTTEAHRACLTLLAGLGGSLSSVGGRGGNGGGASVLEPRLSPGF